VRGYSLNPSAATLTELTGSPFTSGGAGISLAMHPTGSYLYAANYWSHSITGYTVNTSSGALSTISGSPFALATNGPYQLAIEPSGRFLYASDNYSVVSRRRVRTALAVSRSIPLDESFTSRTNPGVRYLASRWMRKPAPGRRLEAMSHWVRPLGTIRARSLLILTDAISSLACNARIGRVPACRKPSWRSA
jgi:hypothetical protein